MHSVALFALASATAAQALASNQVVSAQSCVASTVTVTQYAPRPSTSTVTVTVTYTPPTTVNYTPPTHQQSVVETITTEIIVQPVPAPETVTYTRTRTLSVTVSPATPVAFEPSTVTYNPAPASSPSTTSKKGGCKPPKHKTSTAAAVAGNSTVTYNPGGPDYSQPLGTASTASTITYNPDDVRDPAHALPHSPPQGSYTSTNW